MNTINVNQTIESYLSGSAGKAEEAWLLDEIHRDPGLAREVSLRRRTDEILADRSVMELRAKLSMIEMKKRSGGTLRKTIIKTAKYAAAAALLAIVSSALYFALRAGSPDQLYHNYYARYETPGAVRSMVDAGNSLMENAIASYTARDYETAIGYLEQLITANSGNMETMFMHGVASMEVNNYPSATGSFTKVLEHNDNLYLEDAAWYLGLCYMMTEDFDRAVKQFDAISASKSRYSKEARKLARRLK